MSMDKPLLKSVPRIYEQSFMFKDDTFDYFPAPWHYHPEYEIIYVVESTGIRIIGDHVARFRPGDLVIIGADMPHIYINDKKYFEKIKGGVRGMAVQFTGDFLGDHFLNLPEMERIKQMLQLAQRGIVIKGKNKLKIIGTISNMGRMNSTERLIALLDILRCIAFNDRNEVLSGEAFHVFVNQKDARKFNKVMSYVSDNFRQQLSIDQAASLVHMSINSFCRYFKKRTGKTFTQYINDVRITYACELLVEGELNVAQVCFESGYENLSYFNRQFKRLKGITPLQYRKEYLLK
jgi:AraC-like DNA-binding protein